MKPSPTTLRRFVAGAALAGMHLDTRKPALRALAETWAVETAYHEAAHLAAVVFAGGYDFKDCALTIIPDQTRRGVCERATDYNEALLSIYPPTMRPCVGLGILLHLLAGRAAARRVMPPNRREAVLDPQDEEWRTPGTDLNRAKKTARMIAGRKQSLDAVLEAAAKHTDEMLDLPQVWAVVKRLAALLLEKGTVRGKRNLSTVCAPILDLSLRLPIWFDRLHKPAA